MKRQHAGIAVGLLGNFMFGWGLYHVMGIGSCGGVHPECPSASWPYFVAMPAGIIVSICSIFVGGPIIFATTFATVGIASILRGINGGVGGDGDTTFPFVFGAFFLLPALLPILLIPFTRRSRRRAKRLMTEGRKATATVTAVSDTGVTINDDPRVELTLSIQPDDGGAAFEATRKLTVSRLEIPRPGDRYPVFYDPAEPARFQMGSLPLAPLPPSPAADATPQPTETEWVSELGRLNDLRLSGALTDEEFTRAKDRLLSGSPREPAA